MNEPFKTTTHLLQRLHDPEQRTIWFEFDGRYRPIIYAFARRYGLSADECDEIAQQTLAEFVAGYRKGQYDRAKGRLRTWIMGIARHRVIDLQRRRGRQKNWRGDSVLKEVPDAEQDAQIWRAEEEKAIIARALLEIRETSRMEESTLRAFEMIVREGKSVAETAEACQLTPDEVYVAKHRVTKKLREVVARIQTLYDD